MGWRCLRGEASGKHGLSCKARGWRKSRESGEYRSTERGGRARECRSEGVHCGLCIDKRVHWRRKWDCKSIRFLICNSPERATRGGPPTEEQLGILTLRDQEKHTSTSDKSRDSGIVYRCMFFWPPTIYDRSMAAVIVHCIGNHNGRSRTSSTSIRRIMGKAQSPSFSMDVSSFPPHCSIRLFLPLTSCLAWMSSTPWVSRI